MANYKRHLSTGATVGAIAGLLIDLYNQNKKIKSGEQQQIDWEKTLGHTFLGLTAGAVGGVLPDILEPAKDPNHRRLFHSLTTASALSY